ncbi:porin [Oxalobacteraceae bacterium CAVE-383]|nr:porin [Oxalobacteraceae bacterium CAVE-383]
MLDTKSKILAAAIGAAFALPMAAQAQTNVTVYGKLYPDFYHSNTTAGLAGGSRTSSIGPTATGAPSTNVTAMDSPNSRLGFKGTEDLGDGLKAIFQLEMGFSSDTGQASDASAPFSRNTFVGLSGGFGTIKLGNMDTVYKELGDHIDFLGISSGNFMALSNVLSKATFTTNSANSFHLRRTNSFYYTSPTIGGFTGLFDWSPNEVAGNASAGVISTGVTYEGGPIYAALAYEQHKDMFGGSFGTFNNGTTTSSATSTSATPAGLSSKDQAIRGTFQWQFDNNFQLETNVAYLKYTESGQTAAGKFDTYKHYTWSVGARKQLAAWTLVSTYGQAQAGSCTLTGGVNCDTYGLQARMLNLGAGYSLSKRTMLFGVYSYYGNTTGVGSNLQINSAKPAAGVDQSTFALGISHSF